jgi:hypothetical protein
MEAVEYVTMQSVFYAKLYLLHISGFQQQLLPNFCFIHKGMSAYAHAFPNQQNSSADKLKLLSKPVNHGSRFSL